MAKKKAVTAFQMAKRICDRSDNIYNKKIITRQVVTDILQMYMDECRKALLEGERIEIARVGTIVPEIKVHEGNYNLPVCNKAGGNPPYTKLKMTRSDAFGSIMNQTLTENMEQGVYGLEKLLFSRQQINILKKSGYLLEDAEETEDGEE